MISSVCERTQSGIKAIETVYNGYRFRSRLEARWAVFFDAAGIEYEYEPEGFEDSNGLMYLPDFYLPQYEWYVEVKAPRDGATEEIKRASEFVGDKISVLLLLGNIPKPHKSGVDLWHYSAIYYNTLRRERTVERVCFDLDYDSLKAEYDGLYINTWLFADKICSNTIYGITHNIEEALSAKHDFDVYKEANQQSSYVEFRFGKDTRNNSVVNLLNYPYQKARQARFEHGECG